MQKCVETKKDAIKRQAEALNVTYISRQSEMEEQQVSYAETAAVR